MRKYHLKIKCIYFSIQALCTIYSCWKCRKQLKCISWNTSLFWISLRDKMIGVFWNVWFWFTSPSNIIVVPMFFQCWKKDIFLFVISKIKRNEHNGLATVQSYGRPPQGYLQSRFKVMTVIPSSAITLLHHFVLYCASTSIGM